MVSATWDEVRARRLDRSFLAARASVDRVVGVAHDLGGVHAQVQASAELQLGLRIDRIVRAEVRGALWERRLLVKAWTLRGTLHLHPADELALWHAARRAVAGAHRSLPPLPAHLRPGALWRLSGVVLSTGVQSSASKRALRIACLRARRDRRRRPPRLRACWRHGFPAAGVERSVAARVRRLR